jgi:hypothetical protein
MEEKYLQQGMDLLKEFNSSLEEISTNLENIQDNIESINDKIEAETEMSFPEQILDVANELVTSYNKSRVGISREINPLAKLKANITGIEFYGNSDGLSDNDMNKTVDYTLKSIENINNYKLNQPQKDIHLKMIAGVVPFFKTALKDQSMETILQAIVENIDITNPKQALYSLDSAGNRIAGSLLQNMNDPLSYVNDIAQDMRNLGNNIVREKEIIDNVESNLYNILDNLKSNVEDRRRYISEVKDGIDKMIDLQWNTEKDFAGLIQKTLTTGADLVEMYVPAMTGALLTPPDLSTMMNGISPEHLENVNHMLNDAIDKALKDPSLTPEQRILLEEQRTELHDKMNSVRSKMGAYDSESDNAYISPFGGPFGTMDLSFEEEDSDDEDSDKKEDSDEEKEESTGFDKLFD